jgi:hypothetical protein
MPLPASVRVVGYTTGALGIGLLAFTIALRIGSRWPLEWMEGASLQHAIRLLAGQPLYAAPSAEFIPYVYPPLFYLPVAAAISVFGPSLWVGRLVSVLALSGSLACLFVTLRRTTGSAAIGGWGAGVYALGFGYTGGFLDLVRVDSFFMFCVLFGIERLSAGAIGAGLAALVFSCFAKQHGLLFLIAAGCALAASVLRDRDAAPAPESPRLVWQLMAAGAGFGATVVLLQLMTGGHFLDYMWRVPAGHGVVPHLLATYFAVDVFVYLPVLALFTILTALGRHRQSWAAALGGGRAALGWALVAAGLAASALGRAHPGGDDNVRLPGFALLILAAGTAFPFLYRAVQNRLLRIASVVALALQPLMLLQLPAAHAPSERSARQFDALLSALERCSNGDRAHAVALDHALLTGRPFLHTMALSDLTQSDAPDLSVEATRALVEALSSANAPPSLAASTMFPALRVVLDRDYSPCEELPALRLASGYEVGATVVHRRRTP